MSWRSNPWITRVYPSCDVLKLDEGLLISQSSTPDIRYISQAYYRMRCFQSAIPMMNSNSAILFDVEVQTLPIVRQSWHEFTATDNRGSFQYSVTPIVYSIASAAVITWFLTLFVLTNYTIKSSFLLRSSTVISSAYLVIVSIRALYELHKQQSAGYLFGSQVLDQINGSLYLNIIDLVVVLILQINQVQVIMRIFARQSDKRLTLLTGVAASVISQVIWAISKFNTFDEGSEAGDILPTFIYLTRIAMSVCYAALISVFLITKIRYIIANRSIWLLSVMTFILIYSPVAFFIADVANAFVHDLSEIFSVVTYVICVVIPWEWCNKFNVIMKAKEKEGILGRQFYEDELYELDGYELFVEEEEATGDVDDPDDRPTPPNDGSGGASVPRNRPRRLYNDRGISGQDLIKAKKVVSALTKTKQAFISITDAIIATGFAIPRSVSAANSPVNQNLCRNLRHEENAVGESIQLNRLTRSRTDDNAAVITHSTQQDTSTRHRRDIYVYSTKQVILDVDDDLSD